MVKILYDSRWIAPHGIGRVAGEYRARLGRDFEVTDHLEDSKPSSPLDAVRLARAFRRSGADILFTPGYNGSPFAGGRQIFIVHDLIHFGPQEPGGAKKRLYYNTMVRWAARRAQLLTVSDYSAAEIARRWPEQRGRIGVVHNGVADDFVTSGAPQTTARTGLVLFSNARWQKNLPAMLAAIRAWQDAGGPASDEPVTFIGGDQPARAMAEGAGLRNLSFPGKISDAALADLLRGARALLFCSLLEGFGLPVLEALACGCPVVASDIPVFREIADQGCVFVDPTDVAAIAAGIAQATCLKVDADTQSGIPRDFDWDRSYAKISNLIRSMA